MTVLRSYDLNGKKLSFANWISNLSPQETPFTSMTKKESIEQTLFQWQTDFLMPAGENAMAEGTPAGTNTLETTDVLNNVTQILRKVVKVSDTANSLANYGRGREIQYQMEKAGKELKRDLEFAFLNNGEAVEGSGTVPRETAGFRGLVADVNAAHPETGATVHRNYLTAYPTEADIFNTTYNLYLAGSCASIIMFHPSMSHVFSSLQEKSNTRKRIFENTDRFSVYVNTIVDPLGQEYKLIPNRWMPKDTVYFFEPEDWTQMVLRPPQRTKLSKKGSHEKWMIEMEVGLRHKNPFASGILEKSSTRATRHIFNAAEFYINGIKKIPQGDRHTALINTSFRLGLDLLDSFTPKVDLRDYEDENVSVVCYKDDKLFARYPYPLKAGEKFTWTISNNLYASDSGKYELVAQTDSAEDIGSIAFDFTVEPAPPVLLPPTDPDVPTVAEKDISIIRKAVDYNNQDVMNVSRTYTLTNGSKIKSLIRVEVQDDCYDGTAYLWKRNGTAFDVVSQSDVLSGDASFGFDPVEPSDAGVYLVMVQKGTHFHSTEPFIVNVIEPAAPTPFVPDSISVGGWAIQENIIHETMVDVRKGDDTVEIRMSINPSFDGKKIELIQMIGKTVVNTRTAAAGANVWTMTFTKASAGYDLYIFRIRDGDVIYYSPSFRLRVNDPTAPTVPEVSDLFFPEYSYAGNGSLSTDGLIATGSVEQLGGNFFVMAGSKTKTDVTYQLRNQNDLSKTVALTLKYSSSGNDFDYHYYGCTIPKGTNRYIIEGLKDGKVQKSKPFTLNVTD